MLKAEVNGKMHQVSLMAAGELKEVTNDVALVINGVYSRLAVGAYPETAELFKEVIVALCTHPDTPLFNVDKRATGMTIVTPSERE